MIATTRFSRIVLGTALGFALSAAVAQEGATVLFSQSGVQIVDAAGRARPAQKGERLQTGERLVTPANGISQIRLPDGSLVGLRPASELAFNMAPPADGSAPSLSLQQGAVRVIGGELMNRRQGPDILLKTPQSAVELRGADIEAAVVKGGPAGNAARPGNEPGSYSRLLAGTATWRGPAGNEAMPLQQTRFVGNDGNRITLAQPVPQNGQAMPQNAPPKPPAAGEPPNRAFPAGTPRDQGPPPAIAPAGGMQPGIRPLPPGGGQMPPLIAQMPPTALQAPPMGLPPLGGMQSGGPGKPPPMPVNLPGGMPGGAGPLTGTPALTGTPGLAPRPPVICTPNPKPGLPPICK